MVAHNGSAATVGVGLGNISRVLIGLAVQITSVLTVLYTLLVTTLYFSGKGIFGYGYYIQLGVVTDELSPVLEQANWSTFSEVSLSSNDPDLWLARLFDALGYSLSTLSILIFAVLAFALALRFQKQSPFSSIVRGGLFVFATGITLTAVFTPMFEKFAAAEVVRVLDLPEAGEFAAQASGGGSEPLIHYISEQSYVYSFGNDTNWLMIAVAVVLVFVALSYRQGERLQKDTEGLV